jgi:hypothetical protein
MKQKLLSVLLIMVIGIAFHGCVNYSAGNLVLLGYPIDTKLSYDIRKHYLDSMTNSEEFRVPQKWRRYNKLIDINPESTWRIYFKRNPEEMYLVTLSSNFVLQDVFNPKIIDYDWVSEKNRMPASEKERVIKRAKGEILDRIEQMAKADGCPDSVLYFKPTYVDGNWSESPKWEKK